MTILVKDSGMLSPNLIVGAVDDRSPAPRALWRLRERVQGSALHPATLVLDGLAIVLALTAMRSPAVLTTSMLGLIPLGLVTGLYQRRTCIETQGVLWYVRAL